MKWTKRNALLICVAFLLTSCGNYKNTEPTLISINLLDKNGFSETISSKDRLNNYQNANFLTAQPYDKIVRVYGKDDKGWSHTYLHAYHPNGQPKQYLEAVNSRASGIYREWFPTGVLKLEAVVVGGVADLSPAAQETWLFDQECRAFDEEGYLVALVPYEKGRLNGVAYTYHKNGVVSKKEPYNTGDLDGLVEAYTIEGTLFQSENYEMGLHNGESYFYWIDGDHKQLASFESYQKGWLETGRYYDKSGQLICEVVDGNGKRAQFNDNFLQEVQEFRNGQQEGLVSVYSPQHILQSTYCVKKGFKHGHEVMYWQKDGLQKQLNKENDLVPKLSIQWNEGGIQGIVKSWYDNGILESQREMSQNKKNGLSTAWYRDGSLMLIEEYQNDQLVNGEYFKKSERTPVSKIVAGKGTASLFDSEGGFARQIHYREGKPIEKRS
ncbi:MAG: hypothetical protein JHC93_05690 [Parachlamydiales bacterium]|nr:hypothetical protein [Parachlamydiales bacterium]